MKQLVLGGVRSGKSKLAEKLAMDSGKSVIYIATAKAHDKEMTDRIQKHQNQRPESWQTVEEEIHLADALQQHGAADKCILVDCLTLWLTNLLMHDNPELLEIELRKLVQAVSEHKEDIVFVSNETGMGIVPLGELTRRYCDEAGLLHQQLATHCDRVIISIAGLPMTLKGKKYEL